MDGLLVWTILFSPATKPMRNRQISALEFVVWQTIRSDLKLGNDIDTSYVQDGK